MSSWNSHHVALQRAHRVTITPPSSPVLMYNNEIQQWKHLHPDAWITFIIPSIGRDSLRDTLQSLQELSPIAPWVALVLLDGCGKDNIPQFMQSDSRILFLSLPKQGHAGLVRNAGMSHVYTPWIGFVDDDDTLHRDYIQQLKTEIRRTPYASCVVFRMAVDDRVIPGLEVAGIHLGEVGISFAIRSWVKNRFTDQHAEDYLFLHELDQQRQTIVLSAEIMYHVRGANHPNNMQIERIVLHPK